MKIIIKMENGDTVTMENQPKEQLDDLLKSLGKNIFIKIGNQAIINCKKVVIVEGAEQT